jgi:hypothetical protein
MSQIHSFGRTAVTQATIRLKLAQLEALQLQRGIDVSMHADISPSIFIASGIDLENEQCVLLNLSTLTSSHSLLGVV